MGTKTIALILSTLIAVVVHGLLSSLLPGPISAAVAVIALGLSYYYGYPLLKRIKEGDF